MEKCCLVAAGRNIRSQNRCNIYKRHCLYPYMARTCNNRIKQSLTAEKKGDTAAIEDERRLMYVAVTRARDTLLLAVRPEFGEEERPSRFLAELGM